MSSNEVEANEMLTLLRFHLMDIRSKVDLRRVISSNCLVNAEHVHRDPRSADLPRDL